MINISLQIANIAPLVRWSTGLLLLGGALFHFLNQVDEWSERRSARSMPEPLPRSEPHPQYVPAPSQPSSRSTAKVKPVPSSPSRNPIQAQR